MILIDTHVSFKDYIASLSKHARKDYAYVTKHNKDLTYKNVPFVRDEVEGFMRLWARQLVRGKPIEWAFGVGYLESLYNTNDLLLFAADKGNERVAMHFIQRRIGFWECHPPMYDKGFGNERYLAKFMWFNLIRYATENNLGILDLGGGLDNWHEMIARRNQFLNPKYKWIYVPEDVKQNPQNYTNYTIEATYGARELRSI